MGLRHFAFFHEEVVRYPVVLLAIQLRVQRNLFRDVEVTGNSVCVRQLAPRGLVCVDNEQMVNSSPEHPVNEDLAPLDADDRTCTGICGFLLGAGPVAKDDNDFLLPVCADQGLEALDPVDQCLQVWLLRGASEHFRVLVCLPRHGHYHHVCLGFQYVESKLERIPGGFEFVRANESSVVQSP
jgi:hypothetical protein